MAELLHQLRLVVYHPIICKVLYILGGKAGILPSTVSEQSFPLIPNHQATLGTRTTQF